MFATMKLAIASWILICCLWMRYTNFAGGSGTSNDEDAYQICIPDTILRELIHRFQGPPPAWLVLDLTSACESHFNCEFDNALGLYKKIVRYLEQDSSFVLEVHAHALSHNIELAQNYLPNYS